MVKRLLPFLLALGFSSLLAGTALGAPFAFGPHSLSVEALNQDGTQDTQAGSHPYELATAFRINEAPAGSEPESSLKDVEVELPPGFVGDPQATPKCTAQEFSEQICPPETQVGWTETYIRTPQGNEEAQLIGPSNIYNIEPSAGIAAEFAYHVTEYVSVFLQVSIRTGGDYGLTVSTPNIVEVLPIVGSKVVIWGVPAAASHNSQRGKCLEDGGECPVTTPQLPLLTNPSACGLSRHATLKVDSWEDPADVLALESPMPDIRGCEKLDFSPSITVTPDGSAGSTPTGLNVDLHVPQSSQLNPVGLSEADVKNTTVALPEGVQISPAAADGLQACSEAQIGLHNNEPPGCPNASKIGTLEVETPLLTEPLKGAVYLAAQNENPFGSLVAMYVFAESPKYGVRIKVAGQVSLNPTTGQLVTTFKETPELPFSDFKLDFFGTDRAPLTTPPLCGTYTTDTVVEPWSGTPGVSPTSKFQVTSGPAGSACSDPRPFDPGFESGSLNLQAGAFTPFELTMSRPDGDQTLSRIEMQMPPGLLGTLSHVKLCGEPQAAQGTCGEESLIGHTVVSAGLGSDPYTVTGGKVFITKGYKGAAYGLSIVDPAVAGPFNLGTVVVRASINIDPHTAALKIVSDPLPTMLDGIPLQIQHVNVSVDRELFAFNPTNCNQMQIVGTLTSTEGVTSQGSTPFQVTNCAVLAFTPQLTASTSAQTSRANGASLHVKLAYPAGPYDANIARVKVELPKRLPSRLTTLQKACAAAVFEANPANCPAASIIGQATATTPVLPVPLSGPAYFVSHGGEAFPSLIVVLQGYGATVDLVGSTYISKSGITSSTFKTIPDVPVGTFELTLPEGEYSALAANGNLCKGSLTMPTEFIGQNGAQINTNTKILPTGCPKAKKAGKKKRRTKDKNRKTKGKSKTKHPVKRH